MDEEQEQPLSNEAVMQALIRAQPSHHDEYGLRGYQAKDGQPTIVGPGVSGQGSDWSIQQ